MSDWLNKHELIKTSQKSSKSRKQFYTPFGRKLTKNFSSKLDLFVTRKFFSVTLKRSILEKSESI